MATEAEKEKLAQAEKNARFARNASIVSAIVAVLALFVNAGIGTDNLKHSDGNTAKSAGVAASNAEHSLCLSWASFVTEQQRSPENAGRTPDAVDGGIDRMGEVLYSRAAAEVLDLAARTNAQYGGPSPAPQPSSPVRITSIAAHCGSAHELRTAMDTTDPLVLDYNLDG